MPKQNGDRGIASLGAVLGGFAAVWVVFFTMVDAGPNDLNPIQTFLVYSGSSESDSEAVLSVTFFNTRTYTRTASLPEQFELEMKMWHWRLRV